MAKKSRKARSKKEGVKALFLVARDGKFCLVDQNDNVIKASTNKWYAASAKDLYPGVTFTDRTKEKGVSSSARLDALGEDNPALAFPINDRFTHLEELCKMVGSKKVPSAIVSGEGGLGKSFIVVRALKALGLKDFNEVPMGTRITSQVFRLVKGYSSVKGLFDILYEHKEGILVFDDCDSVFDDSDALMLLKGALDSYDSRWITWNTSRDRPVGNIPRSFKFEGGCIFITNLPQTKIDQAVRTRSMCVDVSMSVEQKIDRMAHIMESDEFLPTVPMECKKDALDLIKKHKDNIRDLSLRSLITVSRIRQHQPAEQWEKLATYMLVN